MGALTGIKVLDLSRILAGPFCTQMLADLGAEVWKIEPPKGDDTRTWGPPFLGREEKGNREEGEKDWALASEGESAYYLSCNRGKKSVVVNLKEPEGQEIVRELARRADVLVENFKTGDLARYGLDYASLREVNPGLVYLSVTGYGQTGPRAAEPGYDVAVQGLVGIMSVTGEPEGQPMRVPVAWIDLMTGMNGAIAVLAALQERSRSGQGQHLDVALFDVGLAAMVNLAQSYLVTDQLPARLGNAHPQIVPYGAFRASDGWFMLTIGNDLQYRRTCEAIGQPELWEEPRFQTNASRVVHRAELLPKLEAVFAERPKAHWVATLKAAGVPVNPVYNLAEAFSDPQAQARGMRQTVQHPLLGGIPLVGSPLQHFSRTPAEATGYPPLLGEHTAEVLSGILGYSAEQIETLVEAQVVKTRA
ncbi:MAG: CoA transferase [Meiothermus sp.]|nr:CoA transferase [Meiothermus sp.]